MHKRKGALRSLLIILFLFFLPSCQTAYYSVWERLGKEKRHLLKDKVTEVRSEQENASEEFKDVLTQIKELYGFEGGDLEDFYGKLRDDYESCMSRSESIKKSIEQVEKIAQDLFNEWTNEIDQISNVNLRSDSRQYLEETKNRYSNLKKALDQAGASMEPVLIHLSDYVLFLKHNLNARAIGTLKQEVIRIETEVGQLIRDMENSISEAESFLKNFR